MITKINQNIPEFAILGHPNEGKSSVLSTLTEDDSVRISAIPGETKKCRTFPVTIDGKEIISFTDTPGFQNPRRILHEMEKLSGTTDEILQQFFRQCSSEEGLQDDCELLAPILRGAGIIYVADGSRPVRNVDLAEMEILRLTGKPRMAILNSKKEDHRYLEAWKAEFRKHFNQSRVFNAHSATYIERIRLLEALKSIEQDWHEPLEYVVSAFMRDWQARNSRTADLICEMISLSITHEKKRAVAQNHDPKAAQKKLFEQYADDIRTFENDCHLSIRKLFKHNIFDCSLPPQSIVNEDLFSRQTWKFLGLKKKQLALAGGAGGAFLAAGLDLAAGGASLGLFTSLGGIIGAVGAVYGGESIAGKAKVLGMEGKRLHLQVGPAKNIQFGFILLDRALIYYSHIINWAHGRRDYKEDGTIAEISSFSKEFSSQQQRSLSKYFKDMQKTPHRSGEDTAICRDAVEKSLHQISQREVTDEKHHFNGKDTH